MLSSRSELIELFQPPTPTPTRMAQPQPQRQQQPQSQLQTTTTDADSEDRSAELLFTATVGQTLAVHLHTVPAELASYLPFCPGSASSSYSWRAWAFPAKLRVYTARHGEPTSYQAPILMQSSSSSSSSSSSGSGSGSGSEPAVASPISKSESAASAAISSFASAAAASATSAGLETHSTPLSASCSNTADASSCDPSSSGAGALSSSSQDAASTPDTDVRTIHGSWIVEFDEPIRDPGMYELRFCSGSTTYGQPIPLRIHNLHKFAIYPGSRYAAASWTVPADSPNRHRLQFLLEARLEGEASVVAKRMVAVGEVDNNEVICCEIRGLEAETPYTISVSRRVLASSQLAHHLGAANTTSAPDSRNVNGWELWSQPITIVTKKNLLEWRQEVDSKIDGHLAEGGSIVDLSSYARQVKQQVEKEPLQAESDSGTMAALLSVLNAVIATPERVLKPEVETPLDATTLGELASSLQAFTEQNLSSTTTHIFIDTIATSPTEAAQLCPACEAPIEAQVCRACQACRQCCKEAAQRERLGRDLQGLLSWAEKACMLSQYAPVVIRGNKKRLFPVKPQVHKPERTQSSQFQATVISKALGAGCFKRSSSAAAHKKRYSLGTVTQFLGTDNHNCEVVVRNSIVLSGASQQRVNGRYFQAVDGVFHNINTHLCIWCEGGFWLIGRPKSHAYYCQAVQTSSTENLPIGQWHTVPPKTGSLPVAAVSGPKHYTCVVNVAPVAELSPGGRRSVPLAAVTSCRFQAVQTWVSFAQRKLWGTLDKTSTRLQDPTNSANADVDAGRSCVRRWTCATCTTACHGPFALGCKVCAPLEASSQEQMPRPTTPAVGEFDCVVGSLFSFQRASENWSSTALRGPLSMIDDQGHMVFGPSAPTGGDSAASSSIACETSADASDSENGSVARVPFWFVQPVWACSSLPQKTLNEEVFVNYRGRGRWYPARVVGRDPDGRLDLVVMDGGGIPMENNERNFRSKAPFSRIVFTTRNHPSTVVSLSQRQEHLRRLLAPTTTRTSLWRYRRRTGDDASYVPLPQGAARQDGWTPNLSIDSWLGLRDPNLTWHVELEDLVCNIDYAVWQPDSGVGLHGRKTRGLSVARINILIGEFNARAGSAGEAGRPAKDPERKMMDVAEAVGPTTVLESLNGCSLMHLLCASLSERQITTIRSKFSCDLFARDVDGWTLLGSIITGRTAAGQQLLREVRQQQYDCDKAHSLQQEDSTVARSIASLLFGVGEDMRIALLRHPSLIHERMELGKRYPQRRHDALHEAARHNFVESCSLLIAMGADIWSQDELGRLPVDVSAPHSATRALLTRQPFEQWRATPPSAQSGALACLAQPERKASTLSITGAMDAARQQFQERTGCTDAAVVDAALVGCRWDLVEAVRQQRQIQAQAQLASGQAPAPASSTLPLSAGSVPPELSVGDALYWLRQAQTCNGDVVSASGGSDILQALQGDSGVKILVALTKATLSSESIDSDSSKERDDSTGDADVLGCDIGGGAADAADTAGVLKGLEQPCCQVCDCQHEDGFELFRMSWSTCRQEGHWLCRPCWHQYLCTALAVGKVPHHPDKQQRLTCPGCAAPVTAAALRRLMVEEGGGEIEDKDDAVGADAVVADAAKRAAAMEICVINQAKFFAESDHGLIVCPNSACGGIFCVPPQLSLAARVRGAFDAHQRRALPFCDSQVRCPACLETFCGFCRTFGGHQPLSCKQWRAFSTKGNNDDKSDEFIARVTKECPKCCRRVAKNGGCIHMTCTEQCGHQWCWVCLRRWNTHGNNFSRCPYLNVSMNDANEEMEARLVEVGWLEGTGATAVSAHQATLCLRRHETLCTIASKTVDDMKHLLSITNTSATYDSTGGEAKASMVSAGAARLSIELETAPTDCDSWSVRVVFAGYFSHRSQVRQADWLLVLRVQTSPGQPAVCLRRTRQQVEQLQEAGKKLIPPFVEYVAAQRNELACRSTRLSIELQRRFSACFENVGKSQLMLGTELPQTFDSQEAIVTAANQIVAGAVSFAAVCRGFQAIIEDAALADDTAAEQINAALTSGISKALFDFLAGSPWVRQRIGPASVEVDNEVEAVRNIFGALQHATKMLACTQHWVSLHHTTRIGNMFARTDVSRTARETRELLTSLTSIWSKTAFEGAVELSDGVMALRRLQEEQTSHATSQVNDPSTEQVPDSPRASGIGRVSEQVSVLTDQVISLVDAMNELRRRLISLTGGSSGEDNESEGAVGLRPID